MEIHDECFVANKIDLTWQIQIVHGKIGHFKNADEMWQNNVIANSDLAQTIFKTSEHNLCFSLKQNEQENVHFGTPLQRM